MELLNGGLRTMHQGISLPVCRMDRSKHTLCGNTTVGDRGRASLERWTLWSPEFCGLISQCEEMVQSFTEPCQEIHKQMLSSRRPILPKLTGTAVTLDCC